MSRCQRCNAQLICARCHGRRGGLTRTTARLRAMNRARAARWAWAPGDGVQPRLKRHRIWRGSVVRIGPGRPGRRLLTILVTHHERATEFGQSVPYETVRPESAVAHCPGVRPHGAS